MSLKMFDGFIDLMFTWSFRTISFICVPQVTLSFCLFPNFIVLLGINIKIVFSVS